VVAQTSFVATPALEITNLVKHFGHTKAVDGVSFTIEQGEIFGFLGPNGAGKTTTIRCLMDFLRPSSGSVKVFGHDAKDHGVAARARIGFMPQATSLNEKWTGAEHVAYIGALHHTHDRAAELAKEFELDLSRRVKHLSTGNKQKLALVLAFMHNADLTVLDEPTTGLDPILQQAVYRLIHKAHERGGTIFMSSHNLAEVERTCTRVAILRQGKLVATEPMTALRDKHLYTITLEFTQDFTLPDLANVTVVSKVNNSLVLKASGDLNPLLKALATAPVHDIQIHHATLEELFMEFYV